MQRIIGIDPGSRFTGVGIIDSNGQSYKLIYHGVIKLGSRPLPERLGDIFSGVSDLIQQHQPELMAVEDVFVSKNASSALKLGQARGAAICAGITHQLSVGEYTPRAVKQAVVGKGGADKTQVQHMVRLLLNITGDLSSDAADALGVAICHANHIAFEQRVNYTQHR